MKVIVVDEQKNNKRKNRKKQNKKIEFKMGKLLEWFIYMLGYAAVLYLSSKLFRALDSSSFGIALLAAIILSVLDSILKPSLIFMSIPFIVATFGIFYFFINVIVLLMVDILLGSSFNLNGFFSPMIISIFITIFKYIVDKGIIKPFVERYK